MVTATPELVIEKAKQLLSNSDKQVARSLKVSNEFLQEGEWLHLIVHPTAEGISALDYVDEIELIEQTLRREFGDEILIVPARP